MRAKLRRHTRRVKVIIYKETLIDYKEHGWTFLGAFLGIDLISLLNPYHLPPADAPWLIGSFGASSALIVGGHMLSALIGVTMWHWFGQVPWLAAAVAMALAIVGMQVNKTLYPPAARRSSP
jgi:CBS domain-containing membrane protein